ncbi:MAG: indole-3-glycerol-phosphate synthase [Polyangiaceae bacterium]|nr:indole-3-glycerol-phosphate synthase [Polyangiaceae bacterium]
MSLLDKILTTKRAEIVELERRILPEFPEVPPLEFLSGSAGDTLGLICEIKFRSPSAGPLSTTMTSEERARVYEESGASMISVLCDGQYFDGSYEELVRARQGTTLPLLAKEFIISHVQLRAARAYGASAALLIVRCLDDGQLKHLISTAEDLGLTPIVEVVTEVEAQRALDAGAKVVGVNARDLDTLEMDEARAHRVIEQLPAGTISLYFSGVKVPSDLEKVAESGAKGALIGETLMKQENPGPLLAQFRTAARRLQPTARGV